MILRRPALDEPGDYTSGLVNSGVSTIRRPTARPLAQPAGYETNAVPPQNRPAPPSTANTNPQLPFGNGIMPAPAEPVPFEGGIQTRTEPWAATTDQVPRGGYGAESVPSGPPPTQRNPAAMTPNPNSGLGKLIADFLRQQGQNRPAPENPLGQAANLSKAAGDTFGPGNDLRSSVIGGTQRKYGEIGPGPARGAINPNANIRGAIGPGAARAGIVDKGRYKEIGAGDPNREGRTSRLAEQYSSFLRTPELKGVDVNADPRLQAARSRTDAAAGNVGSVDRRKIAQDLLDSFEKTSADKVREDYRSVGANASSLGRLGMGQTAQDVQEVGRKHLTDREALRTDLAARTAEGEIGDQFNKANLFRGLEGDVYGQGTDDRDYKTGISERNRAAEIDARKGGLNFGADLADRSIGDEANVRTEQRGERGFRYGVDQGRLDRATKERDYADAFDARSRDEQRGERDYADSAELRQREELRGERGYADTAGERSRAEARGERNFQYGADQDYAAAQRGERGYQNSMAETATDRAIQQTELEERLRNGQFDRGIRLGQYGQQQNPAMAQLSDALEGQGGGDMESIAALLKQFGLQQGSR